MPLLLALEWCKHWPYDAIANASVMWFDEALQSLGPISQSDSTNLPLCLGHPSAPLQIAARHACFAILHI